jgi:hypothetical protein
MLPMIRRMVLVGSLAFALHSPSSPAQTRADRDWSATLRQDARALHDDIAANHPGPVNSEDPGFTQRNDSQLALALERARDARTYGDYFFALRQYVSSFDDGHMGFGAFGNTPNDFRWPGFVTDYDARGAIRVVDRREDAAVPLNARLIGCDSMTADQYANATLGRMWGRWQLESQHYSFGRLLFLDEGSRYIPQAARCTFEIAGEQHDVALTWQPLAVRDVSRLISGRQQTPHSFETRTLPNGIWWYAIPSFNADRQSPAGQALPAMIAQMRRERPRLVGARAIVLDLRGNGGGSSDWSRQIANALWGRAAIDRLVTQPVHVDWRVSRDNLASIRSSYERQNVDAMSPAMRRWFDSVILGLRAALERGDSMWRQPNDNTDEDRPARPGARLQPLSVPVYFITDSSCGSACLDAVDLWRALGAIHVGRTTSADSLYMEVRQFRLPSGIGAVSMPMKVYRGRTRGSNEPVVPVHRYDGDISDTTEVERWIASLVTTRDRR